MVLRKTDKTQFFTGVLIKDQSTANPKYQCIFARLDRYGNNQQVAYLGQNNVQNELSWCYSIDLTEDNDLVVSGVIQTGGASSKTSALIMKLNE